MKTGGIKDHYVNRLGTKNPRILSALALALENHQNQFRKSGEPYIEHCIEVYKILKSWGIENEDLLIAALLHDVIEDTKIKLPQIVSKFGKEVGTLVESVTQLDLGDKVNQDFRTLQKVINNSFLDPKVSVLKLADRYHNLSTLQYMPTEKREKKAKESLEVYAKLAESLGLWVIKTEIEDLSFQYLYFDKFSKVKMSVDQDSRISEKEVSKMTSTLNTIAKKTHINCKISVKKSGYYHAFQKLKQYSLKGISSNNNYKKINDIISYRMIVKNIEDCYRALYAVHHYFGSQIDYTRFDEFIGANKRINGYEALQSTVDTENGSVEIAIATADMENFNNWGYVYDLKKNPKSPNFNLKLVFTPDYDLVFLPEDAKAIDFAYAINSKLGDNSVGVYINGTKQPLDYPLQNTDLVKVVTGERNTQEDASLSLICLPQTKVSLQKKLVETEKINSIKLGKSILESHLAPRGILDLRDINEDILKIAYSLGCENVEEIYYRASKGYLNIEKLDSLLNENDITKNKLGWTTIQVTGKDKAGILKFITDKVTKNEGNIIKITFQKENNDGNFYLRIVVENIPAKKLEKLKAELKTELNFKELKVV